MSKAVSADKKIGWVRCGGCKKKHPEYFVPHGLPFFVCPSCGNVFVPAGNLAQMHKIVNAPKIIKPGEAGRLILH
jgi:rRNA maturation endonuclease Nob1